MQEAVFLRKAAKVDQENPQEMLWNYQRFSWRGAEVDLKAEEEECIILSHETLGKRKGHSVYPNPQ